MIKAFISFIISASLILLMSPFNNPEGSMFLKTETISLMDCTEISTSQQGLLFSEDPCEPGGMANKCCPYWDIEVTMGWPFPTVKCSTGGQFKCEDCEPEGGSGGGFHGAIIKAIDLQNQKIIGQFGEISIDTSGNSDPFHNRILSLVIFDKEFNLIERKVLEDPRYFTSHVRATYNNSIFIFHYTNMIEEGYSITEITLNSR